MSYGKVKRNRDIFGNEKKRKARRFFRNLLLIIVLFALGILIFDVIFHFATNPKEETKNEIKAEETIKSPEEENASEKASQVITEEQLEKSEENVSEEEKSLNYSYVEKTAIKNKETFEKTLTELKSQGVSGICIDIKDSTGKLLFNPELDFGNKSKGDEEKSSIEKIKAAAIENGYENIRLKEIVSLAKSKGLRVCFREYAFRDYVLPYQLSEAAIKYKDTNLIWLDAPQESGGLPWLNPYSKAAQDYVLAIAKEALTSGADAIVLVDVSFPPVRSLAYANYGNVNKSQSEILSEFSKKLSQLEKETGKKVYAEVMARELLRPEGKLYGKDSFALFSSSVAINISPSQFDSGFKFEDGTSLAELLSDEEKETDKILSSLEKLPQLKEKKERGEMAVLALGKSRESVSSQLKAALAKGFDVGISVMK